MQILFEAIFANSPDRGRNLKSYFSNLELIVHGGMSFKPYYTYFQSITKNTQIAFREVYAASEGFFAVADRSYDEGLRLIVNNGIFYEFVKADEMGDEEAKRYWLGNAQENVNYAILVSTNAGLWSYGVGDIIRFSDLKNLRVKFAGRLSQTLSAFGEKIINEELEAAIATASAELGLSFHDFAVGSVFRQENGTKGQHVFVIEFAETLDAKLEFELAGNIDKELVASNQGYATRRANDVGIVAPVVKSASSGTFAKWMKAKGKVGGQNKVPRVIDQKQLNDLLAIISGK